VTTALARNDFDLVSPVYDALAGLVFAGAIRRSQIALLPALQHADRVLVIGGGTGWFLYELLARTPARRVVYLELSREMLERSRALVAKRAPEWLDRVEFRHGTQADLGRHEQFDVIATNFFLGCFSDENCARVVAELFPHLGERGQWLHVDFVYPKSGLTRLCALVLFRVMYLFFNVFSGLEARRPPRSALGFARLPLDTEQGATFYGGMIDAKLMRLRA
jgi:tRNA (cmo5U34)-methyltransferase